MKRKYFAEAGQRFGRGVVVDPEIRVAGPGAQGAPGARLRCDCGTIYEARLTWLYGSLVQSCGCLRRERRSEVISAWNRTAAGREHSRRLNYVNGLSRHPLHRTWQGMMTRCENPRALHYGFYGGRGISVCESWRDEAAFIAWIEQNLGPRPEGMTLDRADNDGDYEPGNVRWATRAEQRQNQRPVVTGARALLAENQQLKARIAELEALLVK